jgi:GR25 family glycosyltransferase involved in LPS biosynthesis
MEINGYNTIVINMDIRPDRLEQVQKELPKIGIGKFTRFSGIPGGARGSVASLMTCIKNGIGPLLLFEDDVCFEDNAREIINKALSQLPEDFDIFYLGYNILSPAKKYSENLYSIMGGVYSNHAILYSDNARKVIRDNYDPETNEISNIFDVWLYEKGQSMMNCFICNPMVAFQRDGYSDILNEYRNYTEEILWNAKCNMQ